MDLVTSAICDPAVNTGLREPTGCWKIIEIRSPRIDRICFSESLRRSLP